MDEAKRWIEGVVGPDMTLQEVVVLFLNTAIIFAAVVAVAFLIFGGYKYMTSAGDTVKTEEAQKTIGNAVIGLVVCLSAAIIVNFVLELLGVDSLLF